MGACWSRRALLLLTEWRLLMLLVRRVQVLASDVEHNSPSLMLVVDKGGRYMFNAGEGLQRLMREKKVRMNKVRGHSVAVCGWLPPEWTVSSPADPHVACCLCAVGKLPVHSCMQ